MTTSAWRLEDGYKVIRHSLVEFGSRENGLDVQALERTIARATRLVQSFARRTQRFSKEQKYQPWTIGGEYLQQWIEFATHEETVSLTPHVRAVRNRRDGIYDDVRHWLKRQPSVWDIIQFIDQLLRTKNLQPELPFETLDAPDAIRRATPGVKVAPAAFDVVGGKLIVSDPPLGGPSSVGVAASARNELAIRSGELLEELKGSNSDRRLVNVFETLCQKLNAEPVNSIALGLAHLECGALVNAYKDEMSDGLAASLRSHLLGLNYFLAQFEDWRDFRDTAIAMSVDADDEKLVIEVLEQTARSLEDKGSADDDVPHTLRAIKSALEDPRRASKQATLAAIRTLENLIIKVFTFAADTIELTAKKSSETVAKNAARLLAASLIAVTLHAATGLLPMAVKLEGLAWLHEAVATVRLYIPMR